MEEYDDKPPATIFFLLLFLICPSMIIADDAAIMAALSKSLTPPPPGWYGSDPCKWQGIHCDSSSRVTSISLASKSISGTLPANLNQLSNLQTLSLQRNSLTGKIPSFSYMPMLREVYLDENLFNGVSFPLLSNLPSLQFFTIDDNPLSRWQIPDSLSNSTSLVQFHAANSSLTGTIPDIFTSLLSLTSLRLSYNDLTGELPPSIGGTSLQTVWINNQKQGLTGAVYALQTMTSLTQVWVHANSFVGPIPDLANCVSLFDLQLRDNHLTGVVPVSITNLPKLLNISLQNNKLQGPMPWFQKNVKVTLGSTNSFCLSTPGPCDEQVSVLLEIVSAFGYPLELIDSWIGNNACNNWVHITCDSFGKVSVVNFAKLGWVGTISPAFANLTSLTSIILSNNRIVGKIPDSLTSLTMLKKLDLANNNLSGKVPSFSSSVVLNLDGNPYIGTYVDTSSMANSTAGVINSPSGSGSGSRPSSKFSSVEITFIFIGSLILAIVIMFVIYLVVKKKYGEFEILKWRKSSKEDKLKMNDMEMPLGSPMEASSAAFNNNIHTLFEQGSHISIEILRDVTGHFSEENILGRGGFGIVYKGMLPDGTEIAVKRMETNLSQGTKGMSEFEAEIAVLSKVRHRNLVALLGYCVTNNERIVVYEYMPQGTLGQHLFERDRTGFPRLTWKQRLVIALDVARGVEYLHSLAQQSFIHRDLKPSNILLGDNMRAKVSDFGLVKSAPDQGKFSVETRLAGTFGYLAPEYAATGRVTTKVDVFAFGVVLMELITGRKALDETFPEDEAQLVNYFRRVLIAKENIKKSLDPYLETDDDEILSSIYKVAELAGYCTVREPAQRPDMSHVVNILSPLVSQWRPAEVDSNDGFGNEDDVSLTQALMRWKAGESSMVSEYSVNDGRNYYSDSTTPAMNESFAHIQGR